MLTCIPCYINSPKPKCQAFHACVKPKLDVESLPHASPSPVSATGFDARAPPPSASTHPGAPAGGRGTAAVQCDYAHVPCTLSQIICHGHQLHNHCLAHDESEGSLLMTAPGGHALKPAC